MSEKPEGAVTAPAQGDVMKQKIANTIAQNAALLASWVSDPKQTETVLGLLADLENYGDRLYSILQREQEQGDTTAEQAVSNG